MLAADLIATLFVAPQAWLQFRSGIGGGSRSYDSLTEITAHGAVEGIQNTPGPGRWCGTHLSLSTGNGSFGVRMGPDQLLSPDSFPVANGDASSAIGSRSNFQGREILIARELTRDVRTLTLRNAQGVPARAGLGRARVTYARRDHHRHGGCGHCRGCRHW